MCSLRCVSHSCLLPELVPALFLFCTSPASHSLLGPSLAVSTLPNDLRLLGLRPLCSGGSSSRLPDTLGARGAIPAKVERKAVVAELLRGPDLVEVLVLFEVEGLGS